MALVKVLGNTVQGKDGEVDVASLSDNDVIGIFFSAHWCGPCRKFTPQLAEFYSKLRAAGNKLEVVYVSSDQDEATCAEYYSEMPWLMVPFREEKLKSKIAQRYGVRAIPVFVLVDPKSGEMISFDGKVIVTTDTNGDRFPWKTHQTVTKSKTCTLL